MKNRQDQINGILPEKFKVYLDEQLPLLNTKLEKITPSFSKRFLIAAKESFNKISVYEEKSSIRYLKISYLFSSILTKTFLFRIDLFDDSFYLDEKECDSYFSVPEIFDLDTDFLYFKKELSKELGQMKDYEVWEVVYQFQQLKFATFPFYLEDLFESIDLSPFSYKCRDKLSILYGGHMDKSLKIQTVCF